MGRSPGRQGARGLDYAEAHLSAPRRTCISARSRSPARSATSTCASAAAGGESYPKLVAWLADFEARVPAYAKTRVTP